MTKESPLLDADWLLGPRVNRGRMRHAVFSQVCAVLMVIAVGVWAWPYVSRMWLQSQFAKQVASAETIEEKVPAITALAEMLPDSLPLIITSLGSPDKHTSQVANQVLDGYLGTLLKLPISARCAPVTEVIHQLESNVTKLTPHSQLLVRALVSRIHASHVSDGSTNSSIIIAHCKKILEHNDDALQLDERTVAAAMRTSAIDQDNSSKATDLNDTSDLRSGLLARTISKWMGQANNSNEHQSDYLGLANKEPDRAIVGNLADSLRAPREQVTMRMHIDSLNKSDSKEMVAPVAVPITNLEPTQKLTSRDAVSLMPRLSIPVSSSNDPVRNATAKDIAETNHNLDEVGIHLTSSTISKVDHANVRQPQAASNDESVIGIARQKTEDLVKLLASVQPRVAGAALVELERRGMTKSQLDLAVDLAQGNAESRNVSLDKLVRQREFDPTPWLAWMGAEAEHSVRYKAISLLGSLNHDQARLKLRLLLARERDSEISRHIQEVLMVSK